MITARTPTITKAVFVGERPGEEAAEDSALPPGAGCMAGVRVGVRVWDGVAPMNDIETEGVLDAVRVEVRVRDLVLVVDGGIGQLPVSPTPLMAPLPPPQAELL